MLYIINMLMYWIDIFLLRFTSNALRETIVSLRIVLKDTMC